MKTIDTLRPKIGWFVVVGIAAMAVTFSSFCATGVAQEKSPDKAQDEEQLSAEELLEKGEQLMRQGNFEKAAEYFQKTIDKDADIGLAWQRLGFSLHSAGDLDAAIPAHKKAATFARFKPVSLYNLGCAYSLKKDADKAFDYLKQATDAGFDQISHVEGDSDLDYIREDKRFAKFVSAMKGEDEPAKKDKKKSSLDLTGKYKVDSGARMGNKSGPDRLPPEITVDEEAFRIPTPDGADTFVMAYEIDDSKKPIAIDFEIEEGPAPESTALGIIKVEEDKVTLCYDPAGQTRPEEFESTEDNGFHIFVMTKKPAVFDAGQLIGDWIYISGSRAGEDVAKERLRGQQVTITKDEIIIPAGEEKFVMSYKFDTSKSPIAVDMMIKEGPAPEGSTAVGIIKLEGDKFSLCYDAMTGSRPEKFATTEENGYFLFNLKKMKID